MKKFWAFAAIFGLILGLTACGGQGAVQLRTEQGEEPPRQEAAAPEGGGAAELGFELLRANAGAENPVVSPVSAYFALAMAANGGGGETLSQLEGLLGGSMDEVNAACSALQRHLRETAGSTVLTSANSMWVDEGTQVEDGYLAAVTGALDSEVYRCDLSTAMDDINSWVKKETKGLIPKLLEEPLGPETAMVLMNALYLNAAWQEEFDPYDTFERPFHTGRGDVRTDFLNALPTEQTYLQGEGMEGVLLPYDDGKTAFVALRPTDGRTGRELARDLDGETFGRVLESGSQVKMDLGLPKFTAECSWELKDALESLGVTDAFDMAKADFSAMGSRDGQPLYLSRVVQKVKLAVNEKGTEAAAVTAAVMDAGSAMPEEPPVELIFDTAFVYAVVDLESGAPLFLGLYTGPAGAEETGRLLRVDGQIYYDTGEESSEGRCGVMDGEITSAVEAGETPEEDGQSNFGTGYGWQRSAGGVDVCIDGQWVTFAPVE